MNISTLLVGILFLGMYSASLGQCEHCLDIFDMDVRTVRTEFSREITRQNLFKWFNSTLSERTEMIEDEGFDLNAKAIVKKIPIDIGLNSKNSSHHSNDYRVYKESISKQFISDENLN